MSVVYLFFPELYKKAGFRCFNENAFIEKKNVNLQVVSAIFSQQDFLIQLAYASNIMYSVLDVPNAKMYCRWLDPQSGPPFPEIIS